MRNDAEVNAEADKKAKEKVDKLNQADSLIFQTEKQIKEFSDKLTETNKTDLESALTELKESHKSNDLDKIDSSMTKLNETWNKVSTEMYSKTDNTANPTADTTTDAEYEEMK